MGFLVLSNPQSEAVLMTEELINPVPCNCANFNCSAHKDTLCGNQAFGKKCDNCDEIHYLGDGVVSDDATLCFECGGYVIDTISAACHLMADIHPHIPEESAFHSLSVALSVPLAMWLQLEGGSVPQRILKDLMYLLQLAARWCPPELEEQALATAVAMGEILESPVLKVETT